MMCSYMLDYVMYDVPRRVCICSFIRACHVCRKSDHQIPEVCCVWDLHLLLLHAYKCPPRSLCLISVKLSEKHLLPLRERVAMSSLRVFSFVFWFTALSLCHATREPVFP